MTFFWCFLFYPLLYYGGIRIAPSKRITSPFNIGLVNIDVTNCPNSSGSPNLDGHGTDAPNSSLIFCGNLSNNGVRNNPGACVRLQTTFKKFWMIKIGSDAKKLYFKRNQSRRKHKRKAKYLRRSLTWAFEILVKCQMYHQTTLINNGNTVAHYYL